MQTLFQSFVQPVGLPELQLYQLCWQRIADCSRGDAQNDANAHLRLLHDSQFIVTLTVAQTVLSFFASFTKTLQAKDCNLSEAYKDIHISKACLQDDRTDEFWEKLWVWIETIAQAVGTTQNHTLPTSRIIVLMQGAALIRLQIITTK